MKEILQVMGVVAGIGGLALGVFLLLFKELLGKLIFPDLPPRAGVEIIFRFMRYCFVVTLMGMLVWLASLWAPDRRGAADELISLLDSRFENIIADIEAKKKEPDRLGRYKGINDADETEKNLRKLHEQIKTSLKKREFVKAHELIHDFQNKLESFYVYPLTLTQKHRYAFAPEPGQDQDYDELSRAIVQVRDSTKKKYPGPEIDLFLAGKTK